MTPDETMELCGLLARELVDAVAMIELYGQTIRAMRPGDRLRNWSDLSETEQHLYRMAGMAKIRKVLAEQGWQFDFEDLMAAQA